MEEQRAATATSTSATPQASVAPNATAPQLPKELQLSHTR